MRHKTISLLIAVPLLAGSALFLGTDTASATTATCYADVINAYISNNSAIAYDNDADTGDALLSNTTTTAYLVDATTDCSGQSSEVTDDVTYATLANTGAIADNTLVNPSSALLYENNVSNDMYDAIMVLE